MLTKGSALSAIPPGGGNHVNAHGASWKTWEDARKILEKLLSSREGRFRMGARGAWPLPGGRGREAKVDLDPSVSTSGAARFSFASGLIDASKA
jgi:hypothetical protein